MRRMPLAGRTADAVELAKALVDDAFDMSVGAFHDAYMKGDGLEDTYFALYSSLNYRKTFYSYGRDWVGSTPPAVLVLAPEARRRGLDYGYLIMREVYSDHFSWSDSSWRTNEAVAAAATGKAPAFEPADCDELGLRHFGDDEVRTVIDGFFPDLCCCEESDFAELLTPGYHLPEHVAGLDWNGVAFYRLPASVPLRRDGAGGDDDAGFVAVLQTDNRCVTQSGPREPFFFCAEDECTKDPSFCAPTPIRLLAPAEAVPVVGVIYIAPAGFSAAADNTAVTGRHRDAAQAVLEALQHDGSAPPTGMAARHGVSPPAFQWHRLLVSLQDLDFVAPGGDVEVVAVFADEEGRSYNVGLNKAAAAERPAAVAVLAARRAAAATPA
ncbi:unnamed protein product [Phaeothamnion confervicola]